MLKIKDNVDLKELEKFGMKYNGGSECYVDDYVYSYLIIYTTDKNKEIIVDISPASFGDIKGRKKIYDNAMSILYDLIKADLVEKVNDKNGK